MRSRILALSVLVIAGCSSETVEPPTPFTVAGSVVDGGGDPVPGVLIDFGSFGTATTGLDGMWSKSNLEGTVTVTPSKQGWGFSPGSVEVEEETTDLAFVGSALSTFLEVVVHWATVGQTSAPAMSAMASADEHDPTHFGARLEYPDDNAFFAQALSRETAEEFGLITLEVPAAPATRLFVTAVRLNDAGAGQPGQRDPIVWFGEVRDLEIVEGEATTVRMEDVSWTVPAWDFEDETVRTAYESGTMVGDKDAAELQFFITVRDPFGDRPWDQFIGLNGIGGAVMDSQDGWWRVRVDCRNDLVGQEHDSTCTFWPYLHSEGFNLPDVRFSVPPITVSFTVEWR